MLSFYLWCVPGCIESLGSAGILQRELKRKVIVFTKRRPFAQQASDDLESISVQIKSKMEVDAGG